MTLILLPGMMCDARLFAPQMDAIPDSMVVTSTASSIQTMAQEVLLKAPETFALGGLSLGGIVAMEVMRLAPDRVTRIVLMDTNHRAELDVVKAARLPQIETVRVGGLMDVMRDEMKPRYLAEGIHKSAILDLCMEMATGLGDDAFVNQSRALMDRRDQTDTLQSITCPALILCGAQDQLCPISRHQEMAALVPHAQMTIIENAGHLPTLENPTQTTAALTRWLEAS